MLILLDYHGVRSLQDVMNDALFLCARSNYHESKHGLAR